jgi:hypothetical protein
VAASSINWLFSMHNILLLRVALQGKKKYNALCPVLQWSSNHFRFILSNSIFSSVLLSLTGTITKALPVVTSWISNRLSKSFFLS